MALTEQQKAQRKDGLFSSDIARIMCGQSVAVALEKLGQQPETDFDGVQEIELGQLTEPFILQAYSKKYGCELKGSPEFTNPTYSWMGSHPDSVVKPDEKVIVEAKTVGSYNIHEWGNPGTDQVNFYTLWQSVVHMACADADRVDVVACFLTLEATKYLLLKQPPPIHVFHIHRDHEAERLMIQKAKFVHDHIVAGISPPPETLSDARLIWSTAQAIEVEATEEVVITYNEFMKLRQKVSELEKKRDAEALKLQVFMGNSAILKSDNQILITWKNDRDGIAFDMERFMEEQEEVYKQYLVPKRGSRRFLPKTLKQK